MRTARYFGHVTSAIAILLLSACGTDTTPTSPRTPAIPTANAFILPGAVALGANAFGDEPVVIFKGERLRWINVDAVEHNIVTDTASLPEFTTTGPLVPGGEKSFIMKTVGTTTIHCVDHPQMTGTLVVREH
jgi:plastocyanin